MRTADAEVIKAEFRHFLRIIEIAPVENCLFVQFVLHLREIGITEFIPFGEDKQRFCAVQDLVLVLAVGDGISEDRFRCSDRFRIER